MSKHQNADTNVLFPVSDRRAELQIKQQRIQQFMEENGLDGLLVSRHENIAWATAGVAELRVVTSRETGPGSLFFTKSGGRYYLTSANEAPRFADEEFRQLDYMPIVYPWYRNEAQNAIQQLVPSGKIASDAALYGLPVVSLQPLRLVLTEGEIARIEWLGRCCADAAAATLFDLFPGVTEATMQSLVAERLLAQDVSPSVFLTAADDRIRKYRHAVPRDGRLKNFGMIGFCGRRWGLIVSITRLVYFGQMPSELTDKFAAIAEVNARLLHATREGATSADLFHVAQRAYTELGYDGEEQMHHQGGAAGYAEREWVARPDGVDQVHDRQAFAWNPNLQGAKAEDTVVLREGKILTLTGTPQLPLVETAYGGSVYCSADILCR